MKRLIYVTDDETNIRELVKTYLEREGYEVLDFVDGASLLAAMADRKPDMVVLDVMMPGMDGFEVCKEIRRHDEIPIVMISARDEAVDKILGLELGCDDYLAKPFSPRELVARVRTIFRRVDKPAEPVVPVKLQEVLHIKDLTIREVERAVYRKENTIDLTTKEYDLFHFLVRNRNCVFNRDQLLESVWGNDYYGDARAVDDLVKRVRKKLSQVESDVEITTVWGYGYKVTD